MEHETEVKVDVHKRVGPLCDMFGHGPVTVIQDLGDDEDTDLWVCQDCGYVTDDNRMFMHEECNRSDNEINQTWRERVEKDGYPGGD